MLEGISENYPIDRKIASKDILFPCEKKTNYWIEIWILLYSNSLGIMTTGGISFTPSGNDQCQWPRNENIQVVNLQGEWATIESSRTTLGHATRVTVISNQSPWRLLRAGSLR